MYVLCIWQIFSLQNAGSCACYCQKSCWSRVGPMAPLNLCSEQQANQFQWAPWTIQTIPKASQDDRVPSLSSSMAQRTTSRATWYHTEKQFRRFHGSTSLQGLRLYDCLFTPFVTNISQAQLQKASFGLREAGQTIIKLKLPIRQLRTCFLDVSQDVKTKWW